MRTRRTLIVGPSWVGDMVMAQALFKLLKDREPDRVIDVLAPAWSLPIVARMPEVQNGIAAETGHGEIGFGKRRRIAKSLAEVNYDDAIVMPRSFKSALIPWIAGIPVRTGFRGEVRFGLINDVRILDRQRLDQTVKRFIVLGIGPDEGLPDVPQPRLRVDERRRASLAEHLELDTTGPIVALMPGAEYGPAKCWPLQQFAELATSLGADGHSVWIMGSEKDAAAGESIASNSAAVNLCGRTTLEDVIDLMSFCDQAVSNDSGLMHVAAAVGLHVHAIYGSSSPDFTPPLTDQRDIHFLGLDCSPCFKRECPLGHLNCLHQILPSMVLERIRAASGA